MMERVGPQRGFTLIELLMVVVIIGLLASVLVPKFATTREKGFVAQMKSDLRNLATAEESYFYDYQIYTPTLSNLGTFRASEGVTITVIEATMGGWSASAKHRNSARECFLYVGNVAPVGVARSDGQVECS